MDWPRADLINAVFEPGAALMVLNHSSSTINCWHTLSFSRTKVIDVFSGRITSTGTLASRAIKAASLH